jgi:hypothetical protein
VAGLLSAVPTRDWANFQGHLLVVVRNLAELAKAVPDVRRKVPIDVWNGTLAGLLPVINRYFRYPALQIKPNRDPFNAGHQFFLLSRGGFLASHAFSNSDRENSSILGDRQ